VLVFGVVFVVAGLAFKLGAAPFHMWVPDVYQGAPTAVTLLIGGAPKFAAFAITIRLLVEGMLGLAVDWQQMFIVLAVASLVVGNLAAIAQTNLKRMLAYSTIAQMGFVVLGLRPAWSAATRCRRQRLQLGDVLPGHLRADDAGHLRPDHVPVAPGLRERGDRRPRRPGQAQPLGGRRDDGVHVLAGRRAADGGLLRQAGVLQALVTTNVTGYIVLAVVAVLLSLIGAFYYLRVVKVMYFDEPDGRPRPSCSAQRRHGAAGAQRRGGAGVRPAARRPDGDVPRRHRQGAGQLSAAGARRSRGRRRGT
jgi:NADH-quinone oxidoreductase subunit N